MLSAALFNFNLLQHKINMLLLVVLCFLPNRFRQLDGEGLLSVVGLSSVISSSKPSIICRGTAVWLELTSTDKQPAYDHFPQTEVLKSELDMFIPWHTRTATHSKIFFAFLLFPHLLLCYLPNTFSVLMVVLTIIPCYKSVNQKNMGILFLWQKQKYNILLLIFGKHVL